LPRHDGLVERSLQALVTVRQARVRVTMTSVAGRRHDIGHRVLRAGRAGGQSRAGRARADQVDRGIAEDAERRRPLVRPAQNECVLRGPAWQHRAIPWRAGE